MYMLHIYIYIYIYIYILSYYIIHIIIYIISLYIYTYRQHMQKGGGFSLRFIFAKILNNFKILTFTKSSSLRLFFFFILIGFTFTNMKTENLTEKVNKRKNIKS